MCHHHRLFAVKHNGRVLKRFLAVLQHVVQIGDTALKHATEVARDQASTNR